MKKIAIYLITICFFYSCDNRENKLSEKVTFDEEFNMLFSTDSNGITGADGIYSIPINNTKSIFITGDCFLGNVKNKKRDYNTKMLNNSFIIIEGGKATPIYNGNSDNPHSQFVPNQDGEIKKWYWCSHGFIKKDTIYAFAMRMYNEIPEVNKNKIYKDKIEEFTANQWAFRIETLDLLKFTLDDYKLISKHEVGYVTKSKIHFGNSVMVDGDYVYFYGTRDDSPQMSNLYVARTKFSSSDFTTGWEFYNGITWVKNVDEALKINPNISVSEQFSVFKYKKQFILLTQRRGIQEPDIFTYVSKTPFGKYRNKKLIYSTTEQKNKSGKIFTYNALAHPQYIKDGKLLVSYCVNSLNVQDIFHNADNYRPKFIRVPMNKILE